jgi:hypothetical protein
MHAFGINKWIEIETSQRDVRRGPWPLPSGPKTLSRWRPRTRRKARPSFSSCSPSDSENERKSQIIIQLNIILFVVHFYFKKWIFVTNHRSWETRINLLFQFAAKKLGRFEKHCKNLQIFKRAIFSEFAPSMNTFQKRKLSFKLCTIIYLINLKIKWSYN